MVLATAQILSAMQLEDGSGADPKAMKYILSLALPMIALIGLENLSTAMLLFAIIFLMMFIGRVPIKQLGKVVGYVMLIGVLAFGIVYFAGTDAEAADKTEQTTNAEKKKEGTIAKVFHRFGTWRNRLVNHQPRPEDPKDYNVRENYQVAHSNFAIASSGIIGKGPGNSVERDYLPQAFSDFIFSIIIEEMGLIGAIAVVFLYIVLLFRSARISGRCENNFPAFLVMGLALLLATQAAINMMVAVGIGPVTGQPLPLVSKGGTSTLVSCAYIGVILSVSRSAKRIELRPQSLPKGKAHLNPSTREELE
jgi:cell division protein FtsW